MSASRRRVVTTVVAGTLVAAALGTATWVVLDTRESSRAASAAEHQRQRPATAPVTKGDLTESRTIAGRLGYGTPTTIAGSAPGTLTWLPEPGQVVRRDEPLYAVDERPVRTMYGSVPLWRTLESGVEGEDVLQLNQNLADLGYPVSVDRVFGKRTRAAVLRWQRDRGLERTGTITASEVAFVDGEVRVASVDGVLGQPAGADLLSVTSTKRVVQATVSQQDAVGLPVGTEVTVRVNGAGDPLPGKVTDAVPEDAKDGGSPQVAVTIDFDAGDRDLPPAASAQVQVRGRSEQGVLSVPVAALVSGKGDGYAVDVLRRDGSTHRVRVDAGFVAQGRVAVTGDLHEGDRVVVPS